MGTKPADIEREIREHRAGIERKRRNVEGRARSDLEEVRNRLTTRVTERTQINRYVEERPLTTMLGAFGAGIMMGMASDRLTSGGSEPESQQRRGRVRVDRGRNSGLLSGLMASASGVVGSELQDELRDMVRGVLGDRGQSSQRNVAPETMFREHEFDRQEAGSPTNGHAPGPVRR